MDDPGVGDGSSQHGTGGGVGQVGVSFVGGAGWLRQYVAGGDVTGRRD